MLADPDQGFRKHLRTDDFVSKNRRWMHVGSVASLFDVERAIFQGGRFHRAELCASDAVELIVFTDLRFLRGKAVAMDGSFGSSADVAGKL